MGEFRDPGTLEEPQVLAVVAAQPAVKAERCKGWPRSGILEMENCGGGARPSPKSSRPGGSEEPLLGRVDGVLANSSRISLPVQKSLSAGLTATANCNAMQGRAPSTDSVGLARIQIRQNKW